MTKEEKLVLMKERYAKLKNNPKNVKSPGVVHKLRRRIAKMEANNE